MTQPRRCRATSKRTGEQCGQYAPSGSVVCRWHGGEAPRSKNAAHKRQQRSHAEEAVQVYGLPRDVDPHTALAEEVARTAGHVAWLNAKLQQAREDNDLTETVYTEGGSHIKPSVWLELYQKERAHLAKVSRDAIAGGVQKRQVELAEQQGALIARVIDGVLSDLGVRDHPEAPKVVRRHLTAVAE